MLVGVCLSVGVSAQSTETQITTFPNRNRKIRIPPTTTRLLRWFYIRPPLEEAKAMAIFRAGRQPAAILIYFRPCLSTQSFRPSGCDSANPGGFLWSTSSWTLNAERSSSTTVFGRSPRLRKILLAARMFWKRSLTSVSLIAARSSATSTTSIALKSPLPCAIASVISESSLSIGSKSVHPLSWNLKYFPR